MKRKSRQPRFGLPIAGARSGSRRRSANRRHSLWVESLENRAMLTTLYVDGVIGDDGNDGSEVAPFATIQAAVDAAVDDGVADEIVIAPGTYEENLDIEHGDPISLSGDGDGVVIDGDGSDAISITNGDVAIRNLTIVNADDGIDAEDSSLRLTQVNVIGGAGRGVETDNMTRVTVVGGTFAYNSGDGIKVDGAEEVSIVNASIKYMEDGLDLEGINRIEVRNVDVIEANDDGIEIDDSDTVVIVNSRVSHSGDDGLDIDNSRWISLVRVVSTNNGGSGLQIEAGIGEDPIEYVSVVRGFFSANEEDGIQIVEESEGDERGQIDKVILTSIRATQNTESGLDIDFLGDLILKSIRSNDNGEEDNLPSLVVPPFPGGNGGGPGGGQGGGQNGQDGSAGGSGGGGGSG